MNTAGFEFRSDKLWDAYIEWEKSQGQLQRVTALYDKVMTVPTQMYSQHFEKFKEHINSNPVRETLSTEELLKLRAEVAAAPPGVTTDTEPLVNVAASMSPPGVDEDSPSEGDDVAPGTETLVAPGEESSITIEKQDDAASIAIKEKVIAARAEKYAKLEDEVRKIWAFEEAIKRPYFHVKPLERVQLKNWREYLDFEISNGTHQRIVALFERCVIACALYEDFWQRFAQYMENHSIEGCRSVYERACTIHLLRKPNIHLAWAAFEEQHGNTVKASQVLETLDCAVPGLAMVKTRRANLERRLGNNNKAAEIYESAIREASDKDTASFYSVRYSRYLAKVVKNAEKSRTVITEAIEKDNLNKRLYLQLLDLELGALPIDEDRVEAVFDLVKNSNLPTEVKQGFSQRRLEVLEDFSSSIAKIMKAHEAHAKLYKVKTVTPTPSGKKRTQDEGSEHKAKAQKTEGAADASSVVSSVVGTEAYEAAYPNAYSAAYSYATPAHTTQNQWAAYNTAAQPAGYNYNQWYQQYGAAYGHAPSATTQ